MRGVVLRAGLGVLSSLAVSLAAGLPAAGGAAPEVERVIVSPGMSPYAFRVPEGVTSVTVTALGAGGGTGALAGWVADAEEVATAPGRAGGSATAELDVQPGEVLRVHVGARGGDGVARGIDRPDGSTEPYARAGAAGANGGGAGAAHSAELFGACAAGSGGGGGSSDVRRGGDALEDRVVVAAGGGGGGGGATTSFDTPDVAVFVGDAGPGGGPTGGDAGYAGGVSATGGTPVAGGAPNGALGVGGDGTAGLPLVSSYPGLICLAGGGGGGGLFGGGGGDGAGGLITGGAGGSSTPIEATEPGISPGDGSVVLEYMVSPSPPAVTAPVAPTLRRSPAFAG